MGSPRNWARSAHRSRVSRGCGGWCRVTRATLCGDDDALADQPPGDRQPGIGGEPGQLVRREAVSGEDGLDRIGGAGLEGDRPIDEDEPDVLAVGLDLAAESAAQP